MPVILRKMSSELQRFLKVDQRNVPGPVLLFDHSLKRGRGGAMASAGVKIDELDTFHNFSHKCFIAASYGCHTMGLKV